MAAGRLVIVMVSDNRIERVHFVRGYGCILYCIHHPLTFLARPVSAPDNPFNQRPLHPNEGLPLWSIPKVYLRVAPV